MRLSFYALSFLYQLGYSFNYFSVNKKKGFPNFEDFIGRENFVRLANCVKDPLGYCLQNQMFLLCFCVLLSLLMVAVFNV